MTMAEKFAGLNQPHDPLRDTNDVLERVCEELAEIRKLLTVLVKVMEGDTR